MFVKVITKEDGEKVYNCKSYLWKPCSIEENPSLDKAIVVINVNQKEEEHFTMECVRGNEFIVMNENGKTVDRKVW